MKTICIGHCSDAGFSRCLSFQFAEGVHFFFKEFVDAAQVLFHLFVAEFIYLAYQSVQEVTVVADEDKGTVKIQ